MIRKKFDADLKARVSLEAIRGHKTVAQIASEYGVHSTQIGTWKRLGLTGIKLVFIKGNPNGASTGEQTITELYAQIGQLKVENDFLKKTVYPH